MLSKESDHNVYILGAGFSRDAGAPLLHDFLDRAREFYDNPESGLDEHERSYFSEVFKFKREIAKAREKFRIDLDNIEQLFGLVEMSHRLGTVSSDTRDAMVYLIAKTLQLSLAKNTNRPLAHVILRPGYAAQADSFMSYVRRSASGGDSFETDIYNHFALLLAGKYDNQKQIGIRNSTVITFNYDLVVDDALRQIKVCPDYELADATYDEPNTIQSSISLLKLHGSTNWAICSNQKCEKIHILGQKVTSDPSAFRSKMCSECGHSGLRLLLVPPSWDKSEYSQIMQPIWKKAIKAIQTATRICVIGYSMPETDAFFKFLLALGLAENDRLYKLVVVDWLIANLSDNGESSNGILNINERWKKMLEDVFVERRFKFHPEGFTAYVSRGICYDLNRGEQINLS